MMKRHAYLILAHCNFGQLRKLVELLDDPRNDIYIHVDRKARFSPEKWDYTCTGSHLSFISPRIAVHWGGPSIMRVELALLKAATEAGYYDYYHLLSGMDLPVKDQDTIHAFFDAHSGTEFINCWNFKSDTGSRVRLYTPFPEMERNFFFHAINKIGRKIQTAAGLGINRDINFCYASQWFSITDNLARYAVSREKWLERIFSHTIICDEIFFATLVMNSPFRERLFVKKLTDPSNQGKGNMRFIDWTRGGNVRHPWTFRTGDWDLLMSVPHFWARKFDETVDSRIIDLIYDSIKKQQSKAK